MENQTDDATGLSVVVTSTVEELPEGDERPCAYCNPDEVVAERKHSAREYMTQPYPNGTVAKANLGVITITGYEEEDGSEGTYITKNHGRVAATYVTDVVEPPEDAGIIKADYLLRFGHKEGTGVEVPVCDMCIVDVPIEYNGQTTLSEMDYRYAGNGKVRERVVERDPVTGEVFHKKVPPQDE